MPHLVKSNSMYGARMTQMTRHLLLLLPTTRIFMSSMFNIIAAGLVSTSSIIDAARKQCLQYLSRTRHSVASPRIPELTGRLPRARGLADHCDGKKRKWRRDKKLLSILRIAGRWKTFGRTSSQHRKRPS